MVEREREGGTDRERGVWEDEGKCKGSAREGKERWFIIVTHSSFVIHHSAFSIQYTVYDIR